MTCHRSHECDPFSGEKVTRPALMRTILQHAIMIFLGLSTSVGVLEIVARVLPMDRLPGSLAPVVQAMRLHTDAFYQDDPYFRYITGANLDFVIQHPDFTYRVRTPLVFGSAGFRSARPEGSVWGVAVGDSFTFGMGVEQQDTWVAQLAGLVHRQVINLSVPGWGPQQYTRALERYGVHLKPNVVFYALYRNDLEDVVLFDRWSRGPRYQRTFEDWLRAHSVSFNLCRLFWDNRNPGSEDIHLRGPDLRFNSKKLKGSLAKEHENFDLAWSLIQSQLEVAAGYGRSLNAHFVLLYFPSKEETYWDWIKAQETSLESLSASIEIFRNRVLEFCNARQLSCLDLTPTLRKSAAEGLKVYFPHDSHWTQRGNQIVAAQISRFLLAQKISR